MTIDAKFLVALATEASSDRYGETCSSPNTMASHALHTCNSTETLILMTEHLPHRNAFGLDESFEGGRHLNGMSCKCGAVHQLIDEQSD